MNYNELTALDLVPLILLLLFDFFAISRHTFEVYFPIYNLPPIFPPKLIEKI